MFCSLANINRLEVRVPVYAHLIRSQVKVNYLNKLCEMKIRSLRSL